jgi:hypothetical protein
MSDPGAAAKVGIDGLRRGLEDGVVAAKFGSGATIVFEATKMLVDM